MKKRNVKHGTKFSIVEGFEQCVITLEVAISALNYYYYETDLYVMKQKGNIDLFYI